MPRTSIVKYPLVGIAFVFVAISLHIYPTPFMPKAYGAEGDQQQKGDRLDEIIVTAQRRLENLQDVPLAVSAFTAADLERRQVQYTKDVIKLVPNLSGDTGTGIATANFRIRGLTHGENLATSEQAIGLYVDNVIMARYSANNFSLLDIDRIEVLRGPQGTLFGRNTTGGAVNIVLKKPAEEPGGYLEAEYGRFDNVGVRGSVDFPISDSLLAKFSGYYIDDGGYVDNQITGGTDNDKRRYGGRVAIRASLSEAVLWDVSAQYSKSNIVNLTHELVGDRRINHSGLQALGSLVVGEKSEFPGNSDRMESVALISNLQLTTDFGGIEFITGYRDFHQQFNLDFFDGPFPTGGGAFVQDSTHPQLTQEIKFSIDSNPDVYTLVTGFYYYSERNNTDYADLFTIPVGPTGIPVVQADRVLRNSTTSYAVYAQVDYKVTPSLTGTVGARWTYEEKSLDFVANPNPLWTAPFDSQDLVNSGIPLDQDETVLTPRVAFSWTLSDDVMLFASATRGFKSGGWNARSNDPQTLRAFGPEKLWSYETGLRSEWFQRLLRLNATLFYMDMSDLQSTHVFENNMGTVSFLTGNVADFVSTGAEIELSTTPIDGLNLSAAVGFLDTRYSNLQPPIIRQQQDCLAEIAAGPDHPSCGRGIISPTGDIADSPGAPDVTLTVAMDYRWRLSDRLDLVPSMTAHYVGETAVNTAGVPSGVLDSFINLDAALSLQDGNGRWAVTLECENCTDDDHMTAFFLRPYYAEPRRVNVRAHWIF